MGNVLSRRTVLRGLGTAVSLPWLEAMLPARGAAAAAASPPLRLGFVYVPNGKHMPDWTPAAEGSGFELPWILEPLAAHRDRFSVISGLAHMKANANGDGGGDHARALATFLTGSQAKKTHGADLRAGISVDQLAAAHLGRQTRFPSLEIGADAGGQSGNCDSGYSCAYSANIAWKSDTQPIAKETNPRLVFDRLFSDGRPGETAERREARRVAHRSILDFVADDARRLTGRLGGADRRKLDEYLTAVREIERRLDQAGAAGDSRTPGREPPAGTPSDYQTHLRLLAEVLVLAWQTDTTRVSTFVFANEASNRSYAFMDVPEGHHDLSHHGNDPAKQDKIRRINRFHVTQLAFFLDALAKVREGDGTLLDHSLIVYGSGIGDGNRHNHDDLPVLLAGGGGGTLGPGRHLRVPAKTPMTNLYLSLLDRIGVHAERLGDSTGRVEGI